MAAFRRRTVFAAPVIITLAAGCSGKDDSPGRTNNPPGPIETKPKPAFAVQWDVHRVGPGECEAEAVLHCEPNESCNPPPPRASECPPGTSGKTMIRVAALPSGKCVVVPKGCAEESCAKLDAPCPLPQGKKLPEKFVEVWVVEKNKNGDGGCHAEEPDEDCPPNVDCNPPVPRKIACPPGVTETVEVRVARLPDKTCAIAPDGCNAPACVTAKTPCP